MSKARGSGGWGGETARGFIGTPPPVDPSGLQVYARQMPNGDVLIQGPGVRIGADGATELHGVTQDDDGNDVIYVFPG